jgi:hypothetical protein
LWLCVIRQAITDLFACIDATDAWRFIFEERGRCRRGIAAKRSNAPAGCRDARKLMLREIQQSAMKQVVRARWKNRLSQRRAARAGRKCA